MRRPSQRPVPSQTPSSSFGVAVAAALLTAMLPITGCSPETDTGQLGKDQRMPMEAGSAPEAASDTDDRGGRAEPPAMAPVTGEVLLAAAPRWWVESGTLISPVMRMAEFVPAEQAEAPPGEETTPAQSVEGTNAQPGAEALPARLDRVTIESQSGDPVPDPIDFVLSLSRDLAQRCEGFNDFNILSGMENNYATSVRLLICPRYKNQPLGEVLMIKAIQGRENFYTVTRGRRLPAFESGDQPLTAQTTAEWSAYLKAIGVCDPRWPEHPCPEHVNTFTLPTQAPLRAD